jgi:hypothetical protein
VLLGGGPYARLWHYQSGGFLDEDGGTSPSDETNRKTNVSSVL